MGGGGGCVWPDMLGCVRNFSHYYDVMPMFNVELAYLSICEGNSISKLQIVI